MRPANDTALDFGFPGGARSGAPLDGRFATSARRPGSASRHLSGRALSARRQTSSCQGLLGSEVVVDEARLAVTANRLLDERDYLRNGPRPVDALEVGLPSEQPGVPVDLAAVV